MARHPWIAREFERRSAFSQRFAGIYRKLVVNCAHLMLQVRAAVMNGNLREQRSYEPPGFKSRFDWLLTPTPPLLRAA